MYIGLGIFGFLAVLCIFAGIVSIKRRRRYERSGD
jgi:hypothetical protein